MDNETFDRDFVIAQLIEIVQIIIDKRRTESEMKGE